MHPIKVAMIGLPRMLRDILLKAFTNASDIKIVGQYHNIAELFDAKATPPVDVIILAGQDERLDELSRNFLERQPRSKVIEIAAHGRSTYLMQLLPIRKSLGEVSPMELLTAIRHAIESEAWNAVR